MTITAAHRRAKAAASSALPAVVRVVSYCRRSVEKTAVEFGSIEAQREAIASYVSSQAGRGWALLPTLYEDRNISGATTDRPALQQLLVDAQARRFDVVCLYKFDRISRRLVDFLDLTARLEDCGVAVVSITQSIDTATPTGRLMLNILASFAEFEREQIAERIADKMLAARKRGQWQGGKPMLGYDVVDKKLVVNVVEAQDVLAVYEAFLTSQSLVGTLGELQRRGITNKGWTTKRGRRAGGEPFNKNSLTRLLTSVRYVGKLAVGDDVVPGAHSAIVPQETFDAVQAVFAGGKLAPGRPERQNWSALLTSLLKCGACGSSMVPTYSVKGSRRYGYYQCQKTKAQGAAACRGSRIAQGVIESAVVDQLKVIASEPALVAEAVKAARQEIAVRRAELAQDGRRAGTEARRLATEIADLAAHGKDVPELRQRLDELRQAHEAATRRATAAKAELAALKATVVDEHDLRAALATFTPIWDALFPAERQRLIRLVVERVSIDAPTGEVALSFHAGGIRELLGQVQP